MKILFFALFITISSTASAQPSDFHLPTERDNAITTCDANAMIAYMLVTRRARGDSKESVTKWLISQIPTGDNRGAQLSLIKLADDLFKYPQGKLLNFPIERMAHCLEIHPKINLPYNIGYECYRKHLSTSRAIVYGPKPREARPGEISPNAESNFLHCVSELPKK